MESVDRSPCLWTELHRYANLLACEGSWLAVWPETNTFSKSVSLSLEETREQIPEYGQRLMYLRIYMGVQAGVWVALPSVEEARMHVGACVFPS